MQDLVSRTWTPARCFHVGDLAWDRNQHAGREAEWITQLWHDDAGTVVAWAWLTLPGLLECCVDPVHPRLLDEILEWARRYQAAAPLEVRCMLSDAESRATLERAGLHATTGHSSSVYLLHDLSHLSPVEPPTGSTVRSVDVLVSRQDLAARVAAHRAAFHPSRVTEESYRQVATCWPYRAALDVVVEASDGEILAYCLGWYDEERRVGELEPVGCIPSVRRRGAASAACREALVRFRDLGADQVVVYPPDDPANRGPERLYRAVGFTDNDRSVTYVG